MTRSIPSTLLLFAMAALTSCGASHRATVEKANQTRVSAAVLTLAKTQVASVYEAVGAVRAKTESAIQSRVTGHITAIHVKEGDTIQAGQTLIELDNRDITAQVKRAEAAVQEAQQARQEAASAAQAAIHARTAADANGTLALATYERFKGLVDQRAVSRQAFDEANSRWRGAEAEAARASDMATSLQARRGEVEARVEQAQAEATTAKTMLSYATITAPFAGVVTRKAADVGDLAAPGAVLLEVEDVRQYRLEAVVDEAHIGSVKSGDAVSVVLDALGAAPVKGVVAEMVPAADAASRSFMVKIDIPNDARVRSGMFGRALFAGSQKEVLAVPTSALVQQGQLTGVYVVGSDQIARLRLVTTGKQFGDTTEALSGLSVGERVVTNHTDQLSDGCAVQNG